MIEARALTTISEFEEAVSLQKEIWGFADIELLPRRLFVVANKVGGQTFGAYDGNRMVAFLIAIPGVKPNGQTYLHSHMLGTLPAYRDKGVGRMLKLKQREEALSRGIQLIEWTFDPLELKNAHFNMERLGAIVRRYVPNQYGFTSSHLHGGLPTDRCVAEWWIGHPRVAAIVSGNPQGRGEIAARVAIPAGIADIRAHDPKKAREIQERAGADFQRYFSRSLAVTGFERTPEAGVYLIGPWQ